MAVVLVLLATVGNALAIVLQRKAAQDSVADGGAGAGSLRDVARRGPWLAGIGIFALAVALQIAALSSGSTALVQPVLVMELPFTLLLGWWVLGAAMRRYEWVAVATMTVGLVALLGSLRPHGGHALGAGTATWVLGTAVTLAALGLCVAVARRSGSAARAALYGLAAGLGSGFVAVLFKVSTDALTTGGLADVVTTWQFYLLLPVAPMAFLLVQSALRAGRLIASQPGLTLGNPLLSSLWGVGLLGEQVAGGVWLLGGALGGLVLSSGVLLLARSPVLAAHESEPGGGSTTSPAASGR
jgi:hypothetical protein